MRSGRFVLALLAALIFAVTVVTFHRSFSAEFVNWDDPVGIVANERIRSFDAENLSWMATTTFLGPYQPLSWMSLALDYRLGGLDPSGFHRTNVLLHAAGAVAVFLLAWRLFGRVSVVAPSFGVRALAAVVAALFFAVHPLRCESVCWITERRDVLSGPFTFLALFFWLGWATPDAADRSRSAYGLALAAFALALLSKATAVGVPILLLILDIWPLRRWAEIGWKRALIEKLPFVALAAAISVAAISGQQDAKALLTLDQHGLVSRAIVSAYATAFYIWKTIVPIDLSPIYHLPSEERLVASRYLLPALAGIALTIGAWRARRRAPALWWGWCAYLVALAPVVGLVQVGTQIAADRYSYFATLPFALLAGGAIVWVDRNHVRARTVVLAASVVACVALAFATHSRTAVWQNSEALWTAALRVDPRNPTANENLGDVLAKQAQASSDPAISVALLERARPHLELAASERPHPRRSYNLAIALWLLSERQAEKRQDLLAAADASLQTARDLAARARIQLQPSYDLLAAHVLRGRGELPRAARHADAAIRAAPGDLGSRVLLGEVLVELKDPLAVDVLRGAEAMAPSDGVVRWRLAQALAMSGDSAAARAKSTEARDMLVRSSATSEPHAQVLEEVEAYLGQPPR